MLETFVVPSNVTVHVGGVPPSTETTVHCRKLGTIPAVSDVLCVDVAICAAAA
jgi:hypothetical protein